MNETRDDAGRSTHRRTTGHAGPRAGHPATRQVAHPARHRIAPRARRRPAAASRLLAGAVLAVGAAALQAGEADVVEGVATPLGDGRYRIDATVRHDDEGWDHYADRWDVLAPDGTVLGSRELAHPHENEQPFTRSLTLVIPDDIERVTLRAGDSVHGTGGATIEIDVPR